jgi:O-antigen/teichoic acid export membrane protein
MEAGVVSRSVSFGANAAAMLAAKLLPPMFAFAVHLGIARLAGPEMLGGYVSLLAVLMIFQAMAGAGMQFLVAREIAAYPERAVTHARQARAFGLASGALATMAYLLYALTLLPASHQMAAFALAATVLPSAWIALHESIFIATRSHYGIAIVAIAENSLKLGIALAALSLGKGLIGVCVGIAIARVVGLAVGGWLVRRIGVRGTWHFSRAAIVPFARAVAPFSSLFIMSMAYFRIDVPIVHAIAGDRAAGFYGAAAALYGALLLLPESALTAAYPRLASSFRASKDGYVRATWLVAKVVAISIVPLSMVLIAVAPIVVNLAYGSTYAPAITVLRLLALSLPVHALNGALGQALQAGGEQRAMVRVIAMGLVLHVILNVVLVGLIGISGAAVAMLLSSSFVAIGALHAMHRRVAPLRLSLSLVPSAVAIVGPLALVSLAPSRYALAAVVAAGVWLAVGAAWSGIVGSADIDGLRTALRRDRAGVAA